MRFGKPKYLWNSDGKLCENDWTLTGIPVNTAKIRTWVILSIICVQSWDFLEFHKIFSEAKFLTLCCVWSCQPNLTPSALNYYTFKCHKLPLSPTPTQCLSNNALNLLLSYVLYFGYCNGCHVFDLMRGLERRWFCGEFGNFRWVLVFDRAGGAPTCLQLQTTDILTDRNRLLWYFVAQENHKTAGLAAAK